MRRINVIKGIDSEPHKTAYVYVKYHHKFIPGTRECHIKFAYLFKAHGYSINKLIIILLLPAVGLELRI